MTIVYFITSKRHVIPEERAHPIFNKNVDLQKFLILGSVFLMQILLKSYSFVNS